MESLSEECFDWSILNLHTSVFKAQYECYSPRFRIADAEWQMIISKESQNNRLDMGLQQITPLPGKSQNVTYKISIQNMQGRRHYFLCSRHDFKSSRLVIPMPIFTENFLRTKLQEYFPGVTVIVRVTIKNNREHIPIREQESIPVIPIEFPNKLAKELAALCMQDKFSDLRLISKDGIEIPAHGLILSCRSAWFNRHLQDEGSRQIRVDLSSDVLTQLLQLIYSLDADNQRISVDYMKLYEAADAYEVDDVKVICRQHLLKDINKTNVCTAIVFAYKANDIEMKKACLNFLSLNCNIDFFNSEFWVVLKTEHKDLVIDVQETLLLSK